MLLICCLKIGLFPVVHTYHPTSACFESCFALGCRENVAGYLQERVFSAKPRSAWERNVGVILSPRETGRLSLYVKRCGEKPLLQQSCCTLYQNKTPLSSLVRNTLSHTQDIRHQPRNLCDAHIYELSDNGCPTSKEFLTPIGLSVLAPLLLVKTSGTVWRRYLLLEAV